MPRKYMSAAVSEGLALAMAEDDRVVLLGEDVERSVLGTTKGLAERFGPKRVRNTPISEQAVVGLVAGAASVGLVPVMDLMFGGFFYVAMDQIVNQIAHIRYMSGGQVELPLVLMAGVGPSGQAGAQHSESPHAALMNAAGLKIVLPATPADAKGLMLATVRDPNPVVFFMDIGLAGTTGEVAEGEFVVPLGVAEVKAPGDDVTVVAAGATVRQAVARPKSSGLRVSAWRFSIYGRWCRSTRRRS